MLVGYMDSVCGHSNIKASHMDGLGRRKQYVRRSYQHDERP